VTSGLCDRTCTTIAFETLPDKAKELSRERLGNAQVGKEMGSPAEIVRAARAGSAVVGWKLLSRDREELLGAFPPRYRNFVADHVTLAARVAAQTPRPENVDGRLVGHIDDGQGVEALVVEIDGSTVRPGGGTWHITWSLADGRRAKESNDVLARQEWSPLQKPVPLHLVGARIR
jgi:hypothetical protein